MVGDYLLNHKELCLVSAKCKSHQHQLHMCTVQAWQEHKGCGQLPESGHYHCRNYTSVWVVTNSAGYLGVLTSMILAVVIQVGAYIQRCLRVPFIQNLHLQLLWEILIHSNALHQLPSLGEFSNGERKTFTLTKHIQQTEIIDWLPGKLSKVWTWSLYLWFLSQALEFWTFTKWHIYIPLLMLDKESVCKMRSFDRRPLHSIVDMMSFTW